MNAHQQQQHLKRAHAMHDRIIRTIQGVWTSKVEVYVLLSEFKRAKLYRLLDVPTAARHAAKICAERRFATWEDYLASLGRCGISFGYFAELERLERRYGRELVRLCGAGLTVHTRRQLLRCWQRTVDAVRRIIAAGLPDAEAIRQIDNAADRWQSEHDAVYPTTPTPHRRVSNYRRHVVRWEDKLARAVDDAAQVPPDFCRGPVFSLLPQAWCDVFERHVEIGERLARAELSPLLSTHHADVLAAVRERWPLRERRAFGSEQNPTTHMRRQIPVRRAG